MHRKTSLASTIFVLLAALAVIAATGRRSHASAGQPTSSKNAVPTVVEIREFKFEPATLTVHEGDTVEWKNDDNVPHTVTADGDGQKPIFDSRQHPDASSVALRRAAERHVQLHLHTSPQYAR